MKKIFIVGSGPLPNEKDALRDAGGLRTEQFIRPLQKAGHQITLVLITSTDPAIKTGNSGGIGFTRVSRHSRHLVSTIKTLARQSHADLCLGINTFPSFILSKCIPDKCPFWADLNGWIMAEAQARSWSEDTNDIFANAWRQEKSILQTADKISTVSTAQKFSVLGEMAGMGMLRKENFLEEKVFRIPNSTKFFDIDAELEPKSDTKDAQLNESQSTNHVETDNITNDKPEDKCRDNNDNQACIQNLFRGKRIPKNAFVITWIGGYNNWVDEQTLYAGIADAMSKDNRIYFVSTGGAITHIANTTFTRFRQRVDNSPFKERFLFLGWIPAKDMHKIYKESDIGINSDYKCIETETGARNRLNEMMKFGLPIITTGGSEIAEIIGEQKAGITVPNGNSNALATAILTMANMSKKERIHQYGQKGKELCTEVFTDEHAVSPLLHYAQNPQKTLLKPLPIESRYLFIKNIWWYCKKNTWKTILGKIWQRLI